MSPHPKLTAHATLEEARDVFVRAKERILLRYTTEPFAVNGDGKSCSPNDSLAVAWSGWGAVCRESSTLLENGQRVAVRTSPFLSVGELCGRLLAEAATNLMPGFTFDPKTMTVGPCGVFMRLYPGLPGELRMLDEAIRLTGVERG